MKNYSRKNNRSRKSKRSKRNMRVQNTKRTKRNLRRNSKRTKRNLRRNSKRTKRNLRRNSQRTKRTKFLDGGVWRILDDINQFIKANLLYFIRHGLSCANLAKPPRHNMKSWHDPFLSPKGLEILTSDQAPGLTKKVSYLKDGVKPLYFASPLLRAQLTCCAMFNLTNEDTLTILPYCGESQNVYDKNVDNSDNLPLKKLWTSTDDIITLKMKIESILQLQLGEGNVPNINLSLIEKEAKRSDGSLHSIAKKPPDLKKCLECLNEHIKSLDSTPSTPPSSPPSEEVPSSPSPNPGKKILVVTHSHFMKHNGILRNVPSNPQRKMKDEEKPENNSIYRIRSIHEDPLDHKKKEMIKQDITHDIEEFDSHPDYKIEKQQKLIEHLEDLELSLHDIKLDVDYLDSSQETGLSQNEEKQIEGDDWYRECNRMIEERDTLLN